MKRKKHLLIILSITLILLLAGVGGVLLWQRWTPAQIGDRYRLEDLESNQAVLALESVNSYLVVDNQGRWKYVSPNEEWDDETLQWFRRYELYPRIELYELFLENDALPYGKGRVPRKLLEWAVNMESVKLESIPEEKSEEEDYTTNCFALTSAREYWGIAGVGEKRKEILLRVEVWDGHAAEVTTWSDDIRVALMCNKLDLLIGYELALKKKHFFIGLSIAFVLLLALIGGTWLWQRRVKRNQKVTDN